jgi:glycosyltransferase involved in cell wall biosynthesis
VAASDASLTRDFGRGAPELFRRLREPADLGGEAGVTRYLYDLWLRRPDLRSAYPDLEGADGRGLLEWGYRSGVPGAYDELPIPPLLLPERAGVVEPEALAARAGRRRRGEAGVNVFGLLGSATGIGELGRAAVAALGAAGVPSVALDVERLDPAVDPRARFETNLVCLNPGAHWALVRDSKALPGDLHTIGLWSWEIADTLAIEWRFGFRLVDEIWTTSEHAASAIRPIAPVPVVTVPAAIEPAPGRRRARGELGLPPGFLFLSFFDYDSMVERKNPLAAIEAFRKAFRPGSGVALVLKSTNAARHPAQRAILEAAAAAHADVHLIDRLDSEGDKNAVLAACDCYVSLHRAEGFGLVLAEAMYLQRPVISTGYSGNLEFMSDRNSYQVDHSLVAIGPEARMYYPGDGRWAEPDVEHAAALMRRVAEHPDEAAGRARLAAEDIRRGFSREAAGRALAARLSRQPAAEQAVVRS